MSRPVPRRRDTIPLAAPLASLAAGLTASPALAGPGDWGELWGQLVWGAGPAVPGVGLPGGVLLGVALTLAARVALRRGRRTRAALLLTVGLALPLGAFAAQITLPFVFQNGTVADAEEVNQNFLTLEDESNAQDLRLAALESAGGCPAGTAPLGGHCMDQQPRTAADFETAVNTCMAAGGEVCGVQSLTHLCGNPGALGGTPLTDGTWHWTGDVTYRAWTNNQLYQAYEIYRRQASACVGDYGPSPSQVTRSWTSPTTSNPYYCCLPR